MKRHEIRLRVLLFLAAGLLGCGGVLAASPAEDTYEAYLKGDRRGGQGSIERLVALGDDGLPYLLRIIRSEQTNRTEQTINKVRLRLVDAIARIGTDIPHPGGFGIGADQRSAQVKGGRMKQMKRNMGMVLAALSLVSGVASAEQFGDFTYTTNSGSAEITGYTGTGGSIVIPGTISGLPVRIADNAFRYVDTLTDVTISNGVTRIGDNAFDACSLTSVAIPASVSDIGNRAFADDANLTLTNIAVDAGNVSYSSTNGVLFNKSRTLLIQCPSGKTGSYAVPLGVTTIGDSAFRYCKVLAEITLPEGVQEIRSIAFFGCFDLASISLPTSLTAIRSYAFMSCRSLTNLVFSANINVIESSVFSGCDSLANITVDGTNPTYSSTNGVLFNKAMTLLIQCPGGKTGWFTIPASVTSVGERALISSGLVGIDVDPANAVYSSIDGIMFSKDGTVLLQCPGGKAGDYSLPTNVLNIAKRAFAACDNLTSVTIPESVTNVSSRAFEDGALTAVYFLGDAPTVDGDIFDGCSAALRVYTLPGTMGWAATFAGYTPEPWSPHITAAGLDSGSGHFGFLADWAAGMKAVLQVHTNLVSTDWQPLYTGTFVNATHHFDDPEWTNNPSRFYRLVHVP